MNSRDKVEQHLIQQKARSVDVDNSVCMYRGPNGLMCAAGCLIPDELYTHTLEYRAISLLVADGKIDIFPSDITMGELKSWQTYHDAAVYLPGAGVGFSYRRWIEGSEADHPTRLKEALEAYLDVQGNAA